MRKIIVMTPTRNEEWIIEQFLKATSLFADKILVLDQNSSDNTKMIAKKFEKVILLENNNIKFNEKERQEILLNHARSLGSDNILIALDADEFFSPDFYDIRNITNIKNLPIATTLRFNWANIHWDKINYWTNKMEPIVFVDNGSKNLDNNNIHRKRIPLGPKNKFVQVDNILVLHLQYLNKKRLKTKHIWYQLHEVLNEKNYDFISIYRKYHHMLAIDDEDMLKIPGEWIDFYLTHGIDLMKLGKDDDYRLWWQDEIETMKLQIKERHLKKIDISFNIDKNFDEITHKGIDYIMFQYLNATQKYSSFRNKKNILKKIIIKIIDTLLEMIW